MAKGRQSEPPYDYRMRIFVGHSINGEGPLFRRSWISGLFLNVVFGVIKPKVWPISEQEYTLGDQTFTSCS